MLKILIVDDDPTFGLMLKKFLNKNNFEAKEVLLGKSCLEEIKSVKYDVILIDFRLPDMTGIDLLKEIKAKDPHQPVILMTSYANIRTAIKAIQMGAYEYLTKPVNPDEMLLTIRDALADKSKSNTVTENAQKVAQNKPAAASKSGNFQFIQGKSTHAAEIQKYIDLVAPTNLSVIIEGESGTGKEYVSRMIHQKSERADKPFQAIDCGALSEELAGSELFGHLKGAFTGALQDKIGQFQAANGGTLFLDEIGNLTYEIQVKLLRAIQEGIVRKIGSNKDEKVDVRIIAATNEDLAKAARQGSFREDLYHRLNEFKITVPALRSRDQDIALFANHFLMLSNSELNKEVKGFSKEVLSKIHDYSWPGNLREMKNVIRRAVLLTTAEEVQLEALPSEIVSPNLENQLGSTETAKAVSAPVQSETDLKEVLGKNEKEVILKTLEKVRYNKSKAARLLNIDRKTLYNKLKLYGIEA
ncbi:sigma-54-dependent transcriptional regulator [Flexithrix dorotheae]|uniref:sigma-54-dependent transcriptional regulator n=1 Tax=Flexithrix dorotheae TaxID=70993 RepID=UPI0003739B09|nr:sigma-54 dependent transcriptional regulator [Flexithrix dorotheae]